MNSIKLTYFNDAKGRNELIRLIFAVSHTPYEDELIDHTTYKELRDTNKLPFGQVPILTINSNQIFGQSCSLARYAAKIGGLYPKDNLQALKADSLVDSWRDCLDLFYETVFGRVVVDGKLTMLPHPRSLRPGKRDAFVRSELALQFVRFNDMLLHDGETQFCEEMFPCYADLAIYDLVKTMQCALDKEMFDDLVKDCGALMVLVKRVDDLKEIKEHLEKYPYKCFQHIYEPVITTAKGA